MAEKPINGSRGWTILVGSVVASLMGSGSGVYVYMQNIGPANLQAMARPDPATGTEMRAVDQKLSYHLENHPDVINHFDRRITRIETRQDIILKNQTRIMEKLESL